MRKTIPFLQRWIKIKYFKYKMHSACFSCLSAVRNLDIFWDFHNPLLFLFLASRLYISLSIVMIFKLKKHDICVNVFILVAIDFIKSNFLFNLELWQKSFILSVNVSFVKAFQRHVLLGVLYPVDEQCLILYQQA